MDATTFDPTLERRKIFDGTGGFASGKEINDSEWERIQSFMPNPGEIDREQIRSFTVNLANNQVDRDKERFSEDVLQSFAETLPGKGFLIGHQWGPPGKGLFYSSVVKAVDEVKWLQAKFYVLKDYSQSLIDHINAGIWKWVSIGFRAPTIKAIRDQDDALRYWEYQNTKTNKAEALEGSLVWLGAQYDAAIVKAFGAKHYGITESETQEQTTTEKQEEPVVMEKLKVPALSIELDVNTDDAVKSASAEVQQKVAEIIGNAEMDGKFYDSAKKTFGDDVTVDEIKAIKTSADKYRKFLVDEVVKFASLCKFIANDDVEKEKEYYGSLTTDRLEKEVARFKAKYVEENPNYSEIGEPEERKQTTGSDVQVKNPAQYTAP